jgi:diguanylate cyclase (GGDEF)-like protein
LSRAVDSVSRYGGEEFVAILPDTDAKGAMNVAQYMRKGVEQLNLTHEYSTYGRVTISLGIATCNYSTPPTKNASPAPKHC